MNAGSIYIIVLCADTSLIVSIMNEVIVQCVNVSTQAQTLSVERRWYLFPCVYLGRHGDGNP